MNPEDEALLAEFEKRARIHEWNAAGPHLTDPMFEKAHALRTDRCVNYVWLNKECLKGRPSEDVMCGVPLSYLDRAYANARCYPDTQFMVWLDYDLFDDSTKFFLETHAYLSAPANTKFMNLRNIDAYKECVYYQHGSKAHIHNKVDLSRIIVLEHVKRTMEYDAAFYADFDVENVQLNREETLALMEKNGIVFGKLPKGEQITHYFRNNLHPGYIGVNDKGGQYLTEEMLPALLEASGGRRSIVLSIFGELGHAFGDKNSSISQTLDSLITPIPMHPAGYQMPELENYRFRGLCGSASLWPCP